MEERREHSYIPTLKQQFAEGKVDRREFLRTATLLGVSAGAAYAFVGKVTGEDFTKPAKAAMPKGGTMRVSMRILAVTDPHTFSWATDSNQVRQVCEYLTKTGTDNVTRPYLLESWEASDDLKTWTLHVRKGIKWHNGRDFNAKDVAWNLNHVLDADVGSSVLGLMKGYMLNEVGEGDAKTTELWSANAIEIIDDYTVRINAKQAQLAVPEHMFHYPFLILDPEEDGKFGVGSNGTGAFNLVRQEVGKIAVLEARDDYWGDGPYLNSVEFHDLGDDSSAALGAIASKQVHGLDTADVLSLDALKAMPHLTIHEVTTAQTGVARMKPIGPFADPKVRKAMRLAIDTEKVLQAAYRGLGSAGEHHHVSPIHPEYYKQPFMGQDIAAAKALLAEAGHPDGIEAEIVIQPVSWEQAAVQAMVEMWKEASINININIKPSAQYWETWAKVPFGFTSWTHRPLGVMVLGLAYRAGVPWNESSYDNPEFDRLLTKAEGILDVEARRKIMQQLETIMQEDGPIVQPLWRSVFTAMDKKVRGFEMHPTSYLFANEWALES
ncbi:MAG: ABC transporter substrate-binding protein [Alphaproteobacteria bacterium]